ncbi:hypothetical protein GOP47_0006965 [Adiantum capillus-veneris]|uniref:DC1 domain-containing protein n=1 Tax=Adiantum capillus-veneris TaxID=13818 RepID=A0A9D4ZL28_ADICA|nr:hypothetical protein GOP47_0006965 [Adiantum capillus-veneris]
MPVIKLFYRCGVCEFTLHQVCAALPSKVKHLKHPAHILGLLIRTPQDGGLVNTCGECGEQVQGWHLGCTLCNFILHPICANLEHDYLHGNVELFAQAPRNVQDVSDARMDADRPSSHELSSTSTLVSRSARAEEKRLLPNSVISNVSHKSPVSTAPSTSSIPYPCKEDWEAVRRVLQFAEEMAKGMIAGNQKVAQVAGITSTWVVPLTV